MFKIWSPQKITWASMKGTTGREWIHLTICMSLQATVSQLYGLESLR